MKYKELTIYSAAEGVEELAERLTALGFDQLVIADPKDAEYLKEESWGYTGSYVDEKLIEELKSRACVTLYLGAEEPATEELSGLLKGFDHSIAVVDDQDWLHKWEEYYVPFGLAEGVIVKPVWREYDPNPGELVIEIDPGLAFGTGTSPTTYLAARLLKEYLKAGDEVLDIGCGTGILSVMAEKLGAASVLAMDLDPEAVASTQKNAKLNGCRRIEVKKNDLVSGLDMKADLIAANLTGPLVVKLCEDVARCCRPAESLAEGVRAENKSRGTILIASGIIDDMEEPCAKAIEAAGFKVLKIIRDDCWSAIAAEFAGSKK